ncbi:hypothetical protein ACFSX9_09750 [Flavobacterium ardleyense]|uniref:Uncharacterized protein n=1 Tax=Flavobacterium ardleyense TaxID=2038737 RepID=A0ABW5ZAA4_9FLAO
MNTIRIEAIIDEFYLKNEWFYKPFHNCISFFEFNTNRKAPLYSCEMDGVNEMTYQVKENRIYISGYESLAIE